MNLQTSKNAIGVIALTLFLIPCDSLSATKRPNVVVLLADDLGWKDIGCYGGPVRTPTLDRLAAGGVRFTDFYAGAAVCGPSRAVLLTARTRTGSGAYPVVWSKSSTSSRSSELGSTGCPSFWPCTTSMGIESFSTLLSGLILSRNSRIAGSR